MLRCPPLRRGRPIGVRGRHARPTGLQPVRLRSAGSVEPRPQRHGVPVDALACLRVRCGFDDGQLAIECHLAGSVDRLLKRGRTLRPGFVMVPRVGDDGQRRPFTIGQCHEPACGGADGRIAVEVERGVGREPPRPPVVDHHPIEPLGVLLEDARSGHVDGPRIADVLEKRAHPRERRPPSVRVFRLAPVSEQQHGPTPVGDRREHDFGERAVVGLHVCERLHKVAVVGRWRLCRRIRPGPRPPVERPEHGSRSVAADEQPRLTRDDGLDCSVEPGPLIHARESLTRPKHARGRLRGPVPALEKQRLDTAAEPWRNLPHREQFLDRVDRVVFPLLRFPIARRRVGTLPADRSPGVERRCGRGILAAGNATGRVSRAGALGVGCHCAFSRTGDAPPKWLRRRVGS